MALLSVENLTFSYPDQDPLWLDLSFSIEPAGFTLLVGPCGSGKSSLLRQFIYKLEPYGRRTGQIDFKGSPLSALTPLERTATIAYVQQNPLDQIVTDSVWHELAFALENQGIPPDEMQVRIAELSHFFGMQTWLHKRTNEISGGQMQLMNLAAVLVTRPEVVILDEPCAQLDPIARQDFLHLLSRINHELGIAILLTDHHFEAVLPECNQVLLLENRRLESFAKPEEFLQYLFTRQDPLAEALPAATLIGHALEPSSYPLSIKDSQEILGRSMQEILATKSSSLPSNNYQPILENSLTSGKSLPLLTIKNLCFTYGKEEKFLLDHLCFSLPKSSITAILGGNGVGKSTLLRLIAGNLSPFSGRINELPTSGNIINRHNQSLPKTFLPQNPLLLFTSETIEEEIQLKWQQMSPEQQEKAKQMYPVFTPEFKAGDYLDLFGLGELIRRHPADLSGGELQRAGLAKTLLPCPSLLLLDEPTKGLDFSDKRKLGRLLKQFTSQGGTVLMVSHDLNFCARFTDFCALLFQGKVLEPTEPHVFFKQHFFYTTDANRIAKQYFPDCITSEEVIRAWTSQKQE